MAFGDLLSTGVNSGGSIGANNAMTVSATVAVGDLVVAVMAEQIGLTSSGCTDNLLNTYVQQNAGTLSSTVCSGRMWYTRVTNAGSLTTVTLQATGSTHNFACCCGVFAGPFIVSPIDKNPANVTTPITSPHAAPTTGTLSQDNEVVVSWGVANTDTTGMNAVSVGTNLASQNQTGGPDVISCYTLTSAPTSVGHVFTSSVNPANVVMGTVSFMGVSLGQPAVKRFGGVPFMSVIRGGVW